jgi:hypothetical protein
MKRKITLLLLSALLVSGMANAQHGFKSEPIWAYSWGVGMGTMVPQGNLLTLTLGHPNRPPKTSHRKVERLIYALV